MGTVTLAVQDLSRSGVTPARTAAGASPLLNVTDTFNFNNTGKEFLHFMKSGAGACTVTIVTPGTVDGLAVADRTVTVAATTGDVMIGPFPPGYYNTAGTATFAGFTVSEVTGLTCAIIRMP
jgi:hypothetical protein